MLGVLGFSGYFLRIGTYAVCYYLFCLHYKKTYIYSNTSNNQKKEDLQAISDYYNLGLIISDGKPK